MSDLKPIKQVHAAQVRRLQKLAKKMRESAVRFSHHTTSISARSSRTFVEWTSKPPRIISLNTA